MKSSYLFILLIGVLISFSAAFAESLPQWNISQICKDDADLDACAAFEQNAYSQVAGPWPTFPPEIQKSCLNEANVILHKSYRILKLCLEDEVLKAHQKAQRDRISQ